MSRAWFFLLIAAFVSTARAQTPDRFAADRNVLVQDPLPGDLIAAGRSIDMRTTVGGDAALAGGEVRVAGRVSQDLYAAGGKVAVTGDVSRNARLMGGQVVIGPEATLEGNASVTGGEIIIEGPVAGSVRAMGSRVYLNGPVGGGVHVRAGDIELGPKANIAGKLRYASDEEPERAAGAQVRGGIERLTSSSAWPIAGTEQRQWGEGVSWIWTFGLMLLAAVLVAVLPGFYTRVAATLQGRPGKSLLFGFVTLIVVPIVALALLITLIGAPLALLTIMLYFTLLLIGYVSTSVALGDWALRRFKPDQLGKKAWRIGATIVAVLVVGLVGRIPWVGPLVLLLVLLAGVGALVLQWRPSPAAATIR